MFMIRGSVDLTRLSKGSVDLTRLSKGSVVQRRLGVPALCIVTVLCDVRAAQRSPLFHFSVSRGPHVSIQY